MRLNKCLLLSCIFTLISAVIGSTAFATRRNNNNNIKCTIEQAFMNEYVYSDNRESVTELIFTTVPQCNRKTIVGSPVMRDFDDEIMMAKRVIKGLDASKNIVFKVSIGTITDPQEVLIRDISIPANRKFVDILLRYMYDNRENNLNLRDLSMDFELDQKVEHQKYKLNKIFNNITDKSVPKISHCNLIEEEVRQSELPFFRKYWACWTSRC